MYWFGTPLVLLILTFFIADPTFSKISAEQFSFITSLDSYSQLKLVHESCCLIGGAVSACVGGAASPGCNLIGCSAQSVGACGQQPVYKTTPLIGLGLLQN